MAAFLSSTPESHLVLSPDEYARSARELRRAARQTHHHDEAFWPESWRKLLKTRQQFEGAAPGVATLHQALTRP